MLPYSEHRRSERVLLRIPISVCCALPAGPAAIKESTETEVVSAHGALIRLRQALAQDTRVEITHQRTRQSISGRVVWVGQPGKQDELFPVGIELSVPSESFWGISFPERRGQAGRSPGAPRG
ncbi:MAG: PilZ domain-containing protein [Terriglobia bacterium]